MRAEPPTREGGCLRALSRKVPLRHVSCRELPGTPAPARGASLGARPWEPLTVQCQAAPELHNPSVFSPPVVEGKKRHRPIKSAEGARKISNVRGLSVFPDKYTCEPG